MSPCSPKKLTSSGTFFALFLRAREGFRRGRRRGLPSGSLEVLLDRIRTSYGREIRDSGFSLHGGRDWQLKSPAAPLGARENIW